MTTPFLLVNRPLVQGEAFPGEIPHPLPIPGHPVAVNVTDGGAQRTLNTNYLYLRNPNIGIVRPHPVMTPRTSYNLPTLVSLDAAPTDATLFQDPQNAAKTYYLPKYAIATFGPSHQRSVSLAPASGAFALTVQLKDVTDPAIAAHSTPIVPTLVRYFLAANIGGKASTWDFSNAPSPDGSTLVLTTTLADRDACNVLFHAMTDPGTGGQLTLRRSVTVATKYVPAIENWHAGPVAIDSAIPFAFSTTLDAYVFAQVAVSAAAPASWITYQYTWNGRSYPYYQSSLQPAQLYFLPDAFKIFRAPTAPRAPMIVVTPSGDDAESITFGVTFQAKPVWDANRIADAAAQFQKQNGLLSLPAPALFEASATALTLTLPDPDPAKPPSAVVEQDATIDIAAGIACTLALSMQQFQQVYSALFESVSQLLSGVISVTVGTDVEKVPLISSASDFAGDVLAVQSTFDPSKNAYTIGFVNAIESPIHVDALPVSLARGGAAIAVTSQTLAPALPADLAPVTTATTIAPAASTIACTMLLAPGATIDSTTTAVVDYSKVQVKPDPSALWEAIMSDQVIAPLKRTITVNAFASSFAPAPVAAGSAPAAPAPVLEALQVVFKGQQGKTVNFDPSTHATGGEMTQTVDLSVPLKDYVLQNADTSTYQYRVIEITNPPSPQVSDADATWLTSNLDTLYVQTGAST